MAAIGDDFSTSRHLSTTSRYSSCISKLQGDKMARTHVLGYAAVLITIGHIYITNLLPLMSAVGVPAEEVEAIAFFSFLVFSFGLLLAQLTVALPRITAVLRKEEAADAATAGGEEEEEATTTTGGGGETEAAAGGAAVGGGGAEGGRDAEEEEEGGGGSGRRAAEEGGGGAEEAISGGEGEEKEAAAADGDGQGEEEKEEEEDA
ncbi:hypothetical protein Taro_031115 [Colocasia esculenta]|uniref:Uncharacterized protein n=1 Tax=Colocasia esculenta TaxID=4460 RepID=A0A843VR05_COLES|nr:hypothetical protein [Colocasia esculenta]